MSKNLATELNLKVLTNNYIIKFPNVGQMLDIESRKMALTGGQYRNLTLNPTASSLMALLNADMISTFSILIPEMAKDMKIDFFELDIKTSKVLTNAFTKQFLPWYNEWMIELEKDEVE